MRRQLRVLLLSPGYTYRPDGNFGDPHLVALGSYLRARTDAAVELIDLDYERALPSPGVERIFDGRFDVVGISCYSSFDYLSAFYLGWEIRKRNPNAIIVTGGYHASARPGDFLNLPGSHLDEPSPFDHVVVGEGELPLARIVEAAQEGRRIAEPVLGPELLGNLDDLPALDWTLLDRYRPIARRVAGQFALSLERGCPFHCAFCMERSKGESAWRVYSPGRAERELLSLHRWLNLKDWTLFIADPLFGLDPAWRREMLDRLARLDLGLQKIWALSRIELMGEGDVERYHAANFGLGFGLESGDPRMLEIMCKVRDPGVYLDRFREFAGRAARAGLPWGANMIAGHPGETADSMECSARFAAELFLKTDGLTGSLSIDPYRFYPGSAIDRNLSDYERRFGTRVHRLRWWNYSEQPFNAEWVDPSSSLDYRTREALTARLFTPVVQGIAKRFAYRGPAAEYFRRTVDEACELLRAPTRLRTLCDYHLWQRLTGRTESSIVNDSEAVLLYREARELEIARINEEQGGQIPERILAAAREVPRERFVRDADLVDAWRDCALGLTEDGSATISAIHAYLVNYALLDLREGDCLIEFGTGSGYGAALASRIVGPAGRVVSYEVNAELAEWAGRNVADLTNVKVICADGMAVLPLPAFDKALFTFAVRGVPGSVLDALPESGRVVAPVAGESAEAQTLMLHVLCGGRVVVTRHGSVRYVPAATMKSEV